jgi:50S ribosomal protein L16 3-hydroxylase
MPAARLPLLGQRTPAAFMRQFWHKRPLAVRAAIPDFRGVFPLRDLKALAQRDDVESRLVVRDGRRWSLALGPFRPRDFASLPPTRWTLLVQGVNLHDARADALLRPFDFVPFARLDDLMVSYAAPGGGVGPHFDSYDVFLLQASGHRRWRYGEQHDLSLVPGLPLRILSRFAPVVDEVFAPGDLLYLPPKVAHDGVAVDACTTCSIGFRAPSTQEVATAFLDYLRDTIELEGRYADPDLVPTGEPARIDARMQRRIGGILQGIRWDAADVGRFLGCWLSEPKPGVTFDPPARAPDATAFRRRSARTGVALDRRTQLLYDDRSLYVNGDAVAWPDGGCRELAALADRRRLDGRACRDLADAALALILEWYRHGYLGFDAA